MPKPFTVSVGPGLRQLRGGGCGGPVLEEPGALRAGGIVEWVAPHARQWGTPRQLCLCEVLGLPGLSLTAQSSFSIPKGKAPP